MTEDEFLLKDKQADLAIELFNDHYIGKEYLVNHKLKVKGITLGLYKHLLYEVADRVSPIHLNKAIITEEIIHAVRDIVYIVGFKVEDSPLPVYISFDIFSKTNSLTSPAGIKQKRSFRN